MTGKATSLILLAFSKSGVRDSSRQLGVLRLVIYSLRSGCWISVFFAAKHSLTFTKPINAYGTDQY